MSTPGESTPRESAPGESAPRELVVFMHGRVAGRLSINNSRRAQIFRAADFGILGDYAEIVPVLTEAIKVRRAK